MPDLLRTTVMSSAGAGARLNVTFRVPAPSPALDAAEAKLTVGVVAPSLTTMSNSSEAVPPLPSSAVTLTVSVPASPLAGVPEKVRVPASKLSQDGRGESSPLVAV